MQRQISFVHPMTSPVRFAPKAIAFWPVLVFIAVGDFLTKRIAERVLTLHVPQSVVGDWVRMTLTYNTGAAMNISLGDWSRVVLSAVAIGMIAMLFHMYRSAEGTDVWQALALGLVAGGALGNLMDRLRSARGVVDFIDVGTADWRFWIFNVADTGVSVGAVLLALVLWLRPGPVEQPAAQAAGNSPMPAPADPGPSPNGP